ncbi:hypothetical protein BMW24_011010 [Mycobacterium heckeshornense]|uniref:Uncharacterized protein n=1 Tax=Mycobacterium heckeshornense TaxID=110505 RepID=A0A2G8B9W8_9MYCO|nr:hypothetical protein [Mycobacterium heckeshornense]MCV7034189.1 hypothetical protein [Mycobacterium heckeshornense]PIJ34547.1 hypothetical protein BMW24_011010 [Mycobacterium heckeshornense]BCO36855.1 hypothetical protein MHEC_32880 [Mycobacterium heckeshornense]
MNRLEHVLTRQRHECRFTWCETSPDNPVDATSHWSDVMYTPASVRDGNPELLASDRSPLRIGVGLTCDDLENEPVSIVLHVDGGARDLDAQANLTVDEARALSDTLTAAITAATGGAAVRAGLGSTR